MFSHVKAILVMSPKPKHVNVVLNEPKNKQLCSSRSGFVYFSWNCAPSKIIVVAFMLHRSSLEDIKAISVHSYFEKSDTVSHLSETEFETVNIRMALLQNLIAKSIPALLCVCYRFDQNLLKSADVALLIWILLWRRSEKWNVSVMRKHYRCDLEGLIKCRIKLTYQRGKISGRNVCLTQKLDL
jgi:hypothetical protein